MYEILDSIEDIKENEHEYIESIVFIAKFNRLYFEELIKRGFDKEEAMLLLIKQGFGLKECMEDG
jgi:hypothetical protein